MKTIELYALFYIYIYIYVCMYVYIYIYVCVCVRVCSSILFSSYSACNDYAVINTVIKTVISQLIMLNSYPSRNNQL